MGLLDTYLSDKERTVLEKNRSKIASAFFMLIAVLIVVNYLVQSIISLENLKSFKDVLFLRIFIAFTTLFFVFYLIWVLFKLIKPAYISYLELITDLVVNKHGLDEPRRPLSSRESDLLKFRELNFAVNNTVLYAAIGDDNRIAYISKIFEQYLGAKESLNFRKFEKVLTNIPQEQNKINKILSNAKGDLERKELRLTHADGAHYWIEMTVVNMDSLKNSKRRLIVCYNVTQKKNASIEMERLNRERFVAEVKSQKDFSQQIIGAQEEERKRIAKDIHDGIGQMLTALRFNIDSIDFNHKEKSEASLVSLKEVFGQLIKDVRTVTFNLAPPELTDHGIGSAIRKMSNMVRNYTGIRVLYENTSSFDQRLDPVVETNIYRVVQEAVNNALKYSNSDYILISLEHTEFYLKIKIQDEGNGFDVENIPEDNGGTGNGLRFMKERMNYVNGEIRINAEKNKGTTVYLVVPLD